MLFQNLAEAIKTKPNCKYGSERLNRSQTRKLIPVLSSSEPSESRTWLHIVCEWNITWQEFYKNDHRILNWKINFLFLGAWANIYVAVASSSQSMTWEHLCICHYCLHEIVSADGGLVWAAAALAFQLVIRPGKQTSELLALFRADYITVKCFAGATFCLVFTIK